jgi:hypothetical protein
MRGRLRAKYILVALIIKLFQIFYFLILEIKSYLTTLIILFKEIFPTFRIAALIPMFLLLSGFVLWGQANGDYRTNSTGAWNWTTVGNWQKRVAGAWVAATDYPGQNAGAGTVTIQDNTRVSINTTISNSIGALTIPTSGNISYLNVQNGGNLTVTGTTTLNSNSNNDYKYVTVSGTFTTASLNLTGGGNTRDAFLEIAATTANVTVTGDITMNSGDGRRNYILFSDDGILNIGGGFVSNGFITSGAGGGNPPSAPTTGTVNFNGAGAQSVWSTTYYNLTISNSGTKTLLDNITIDNNLNIAGTAVLASDIYSITGNITGTFTMGAGTGLTLGNTGSATAVAFPSLFTSGHTVLNNTSTVTYQSTGVQTVSNTPTYGNLAIATSGTKTLAGATTVNNNLSINGTAILASDIYQITGGSGTFSMAAGTGFTLGRVGNGTAVTFPSFTTATNLNSTSTVTYQTLNGTQQVATLTYGNLTIAGGGSKTLQGTTTISGVLNLSSGLLQPGNYDLVISNTSSSAITGTFSGTSMIEINGTGTLFKQGAAQADFVMVYPVGTGSSYTPMEIRGLTVTGVTNPGSISVSTVASAASGIPGLTPLNRYWVTSSTNLTGTIDADISFTYVGADVPGGANPSEYYIYYKPVPPGTWAVPSGPSPEGSNPFYSSSASTLTATWSVSVPDKKVFY